jgi:hypothetical protein
MAANN